QRQNGGKKPHSPSGHVPLLAFVNPRIPRIPSRRECDNQSTIKGQVQYHWPTAQTGQIGQGLPAPCLDFQLRGTLAELRNGSANERMNHGPLFPVCACPFSAGSSFGPRPAAKRRKLLSAQAWQQMALQIR